jgi:hypothetical protein
MPRTLPCDLFCSITYEMRQSINHCMSHKADGYLVTVGQIPSSTKPTPAVATHLSRNYYFVRIIAIIAITVYTYLHKQR